MSGGHFDYGQGTISRIADDIESVIEQNGDESLDEYGCPVGRGYEPATVTMLRDAVRALRVAFVYAQRADWLLSGDDGEEAFRRRLAGELSKLAAEAAADAQAQAQPLTDEADMFWDADDPERFGHDIAEIVADYDAGEVVKINRAKRLPDVVVRVTIDNGEAGWEYVEHINGITAGTEGGA